MSTTTNYLELEKPSGSDPVDISVLNNNFQKIDEAFQNFVNVVYPIGSIYINAVDNRNPSTLFGFGTWTRIGTGRTLVSAGDSGTYSIGNTGGSESIPQHTHTGSVSGSTSITKEQLPSGVTGSVVLRSQTNSDTGRLDITAYPSGVFSTSADPADYWGMAAGNDAKASKLNFDLGGQGQGHTHTVDLDENNVAAGIDGSNNMPPYLTVYIWKRTA